MSSPCMIVMDTAGAVEALVQSILDPARTTPIVCLTSRAGDTRPAISPERVRAELHGEFVFVSVPTGARTRQLAKLLPEGFGVYGGCARIWWPGIVPTSLPSQHPLIYDRTRQYGPVAVENLRQAWLRGRQVHSPQPQERAASA